VHIIIRMRKLVLAIGDAKFFAKLAAQQLLSLIYNEAFYVQLLYSLPFALSMHPIAPDPMLDLHQRLRPGISFISCCT
jgi:hypothetical protein